MLRVIDIETTGTDPATDKICEIASADLSQTAVTTCNCSFAAFPVLASGFLLKWTQALRIWWRSIARARPPNNFRHPHDRSHQRPTFGTNAPSHGGRQAEQN